MGRDGIEPLILAVFSRVLLVRVCARWCAGAASTLISRVEVESVIPGDSAPFGLVRIG